MKLLDNELVGERLKKCRLELHFDSMRDYAIQAGIDPSHYRKMEAGVLPITEKTLEKLVFTHKIDRNYILRGMEGLGIIVPHHGSDKKDILLKSNSEEPEPDYKAKYFALKAVVVELLRGNVSSSDVLEKLEADPALPGQSPAAYDDSAAGIERTYKRKNDEQKDNGSA